MSAAKKPAHTPAKKRRWVKTPWQRIMRAAYRGTGVRLSPEDVTWLGLEDDVSLRAMNDDDDEEALHGD